MPGNAPPVATEREAISTYLRQQHDGIRFAAYGLTDEQAHQVSSRSAHQHREPRQARRRRYRAAWRCDRGRARAAGARPGP